MKLPTSFRYATRIWLTAVIIPPGLLGTGFLVASLISGNFTHEKGSFLLLSIMAMFGVGLLLSIPSWLILIWATQRVLLLDWEDWNKKYLIWGIGTLLTLLPFVFLSLDEPLGIIGGSAFHWLLISFGIFHFELPITLNQNDTADDGFK
jgi:hypothetical protein